MICLAPGPHAPSAPEHNGFPALLPAIPCQNQRAFRRCPTSARNSCPKPWPANPGSLQRTLPSISITASPSTGLSSPSRPSSLAGPCPRTATGGSGA